MPKKPSYEELEREVIALKKTVSKNEHMERVFHIIASPVMILDSEQNILSINLATEQLIDLSSDDLKGKKCYQVFHDPEATSPPESCPFQMVAATGKPETVEIIEETLKGTFCISLTPVFDENNKLKRVIHTSTDITDKKKVEQKLLESEQLFRRIFEDSVDGMVLGDSQGNFVKVNPAMSEILGYSEKELLSMSTTDLTYSGDVNLNSDIARQLWSGEIDNFTAEKRYITKNRNIIWSETTVFAIRDEEGNLKYTVGRLKDITDKKKAEEALKNSEKRLSNFIESAADGFILFDSELNHIEMNKAALEITGLKRKEVIGKNVIDTVPNIKESGRYHEYKKVIKTGVPFHIGDLANHPLTPERNIELKAFKVGDGLGINFSDITERKQAEEALRESEEKLRNILEHSSNLFYSHTAEHELIYLSPQCREFLQCEPEEALVKWTEFATDNPINKNGFRLTEKAIKTGKRQPPYDLELMGVKGRKIWVEVREAPILADGKTVAIVGSLTDVTQRKQAEESLQESEDKFRNIAESSLVGVYIIQDNIFIYVNPKFAEIFGYSVGECLNAMNYRQLVHPEDINLVQEQVSKRESRKVKFVNYTFRGIKKSGETIIVEIFGSSIQLNGKTSVTGTILDITERKQLEKQLQQAQKLESIGNLAGGIAHDFNNILASIIGFTELALDDVTKGTPMEDSLQEVYTASKRARDLVKQILTFARQSDEKQKLIHVDACIKEVLKLIRSTIPTTIEIRENIKSKSLIMGNPSQVHQLFMNLCTNAAQAMDDAGGILEIGVTDVTLNEKSAFPLSERQSGNYMKVTVSDTGPGIPPNIIRSIFDPYFTTKDVGEGTGMGLALAHGIVESYGGKITVDSKLGKGTKFSIYLPITRKHGDLRLYEKEKLPSGTESILFVDDELPITKMGSQILERLGYRVTVRTSSVEALELFRTKPDEFDLVITDMAMPNLTGDELAMELIAFRYDIPVILCTGYSKKITDEKAAQIGIKAFLYKPIVKADLAKTVRKVLDEATEIEK